MICESNAKHIFCTMGESAGIGTQITLQAVAQILCPNPEQKNSFDFKFNSEFNLEELRFHILGDAFLINDLLICLDLQSLKQHPQIIWHFHNAPHPIELGRLKLENALHSIELLNLAIEQIKEIASIKENVQYNQLKFKKNIINSALVTAPIHKKIINDGLYAGIKMRMQEKAVFKPRLIKKFYGHTEYLAELAYLYGFADELLPVLMLLNGFDHLKKRELRIALATVHVPMQLVHQKIIAKTQGGAKSQMGYDIYLISEALSRYFGMPIQNEKTIKVAGVNPHAGENGLLGSEEMDHIEPLIAQLKPSLLEFNTQLTGCFSGDTLIMQEADCFYYMHHDQGLAPFKYVTFGHAANITLGLPFIRTSVDHGTALDLANFSAKNNNMPLASHESMYYAILKAIDMLYCQSDYLDN